jgi:hypothetical protein
VTDLVVLSPRLPYRTRARLQAAGRIDRIAAGLVEHGHMRAAEWMWRACRMW